MWREGHGPNLLFGALYTDRDGYYFLTRKGESEKISALISEKRAHPKRALGNTVGILTPTGPMLFLFGQGRCTLSRGVQRHRPCGADHHGGIINSAI
jgi:hypothetical protein